MSSDYTTHRRTSSRQTSLSSPLDQAPKFTPPTATSRNASPVRKPLHDRSNSQTNQYSGPTIRIVEDPGSDIYSKYPVPSEPSQILPPPRHAPGYGFERPGSRVSSGSQVANTIAKFEASKTRVQQAPPPLQLARKKKYRHSVSTRDSDADTLVASSYTPSSLRFSQGSTPPTSPSPEFTEFEKGLEVLEEESTQPRPKSTIRAVPPSSSGGESDASRARALTSKASAASFASTITAASPNRNAEDPTSHIQTFPRSHKHTPSSDSAKDQHRKSSDIDHDQHPALRPKASEASFAFSDISYTSIEPTHHTIPSSQPSPTLHEARTTTITSGVSVAYPLVRAPSATSLRAASENIPSFASRMQDRSLVHQWSSQLSTIPSVSERDSRSLARGSRSYTRSQSQESYNGTNNNGQTNYPRRRSTIASVQSSTDNVSSEEHTEFSAVPRPLFSPVSYSTNDEKDHMEEHLDTISPLPTSVPLRMKRSDYLRRHDSASDSGSNTESRPGSVQSDMSTFVQNAIPAWARYVAESAQSIAGSNEYTGFTTDEANASQLALLDQSPPKVYGYRRPTAGAQ